MKKTGKKTNHRAIYRLAWRSLLGTMDLDPENAMCVICGEMGFVDFHHSDPSTKKDTIANLMKLSPSDKNIAVLMEEVNKCVPVCMACHMAIHGILTKRRKNGNTRRKE